MWEAISRLTSVSFQHRQLHACAYESMTATLRNTCAGCMKFPSTQAQPLHILLTIRNGNQTEKIAWRSGTHCEPMPRSLPAPNNTTHYPARFRGFRRSLRPVISRGRRKLSANWRAPTTETALTCTCCSADLCWRRGNSIRTGAVSVPGISSQSPVLQKPGRVLCSKLAFVWCMCHIQKVPLI